MRERDLAQLLAVLEADVRHAEPEMGFADELFAQLQAEARRTTRLTRPLVLLIAALLVAATGVGIAIGSFLLRSDAALDLVRRSQAVHAQPPPFSALTTSGPIEWEVPPWYTACADPAQTEEWRSLHWRYEYDGAASFRQACLYGGTPPQYVGGLEVQTPDGHGVWNAAFWELLPMGFLNRAEGAPLATLLWLNWLDADGRLTTCDDWELGPSEAIAGREAQAVDCGADRYWIDQASGLLLRRERGGEAVAEVLSLEVGSQPPAAAFTLYPAGFSTQLVAGEIPAEVTLPGLDGSSWSSRSLAGGRAAILLGTDCAHVPCVSLEDFTAAVAARRGDVSGVAISLTHDRAFPRTEVEAALAAGIPVLVDDQSGWPRWEYPIFGGLLLLEADGRLAAILEARTVGAMAAAMDAFIAGREVPVPPPWDGYFAVGEPAAPLTGELLGGGTFDSAEPGGRPLVVLSPPRFVPGSDDSGCDLAPAEMAVRDLAGAADALAGRATIVVIAWGSGFGSPFDGWEAFMAELGVTSHELQVVAPTDEAYPAWGSLLGADYCGGSTPVLVVLDAAGSVRSIGEPPGIADLIELVGRL